MRGDQAAMCKPCEVGSEQNPYPEVCFWEEFGEESDSEALKFEREC